MPTSTTLLLLTLPFLGAAPPEPARPANTICVSVVVILANSRGDKVDPRLATLAREVQNNVDPKLTSFEVARWNCENLKPGVCQNIPLVEDQVLKVTIESGPDKEGFVRLKIQPPLVKEVIPLGAQCDRFLPIVSRYRTRNGDQLLVALRIHSCTPPK
jgi:hypothetical protein